jgi:hypothetical protein
VIAGLCGHRQPKPAFYVHLNAVHNVTLFVENVVELLTVVVIVLYFYSVLAALVSVLVLSSSRFVF